MHGKRALVKEVRYGAGGKNVFLCVRFEQDPTTLHGLQVFVELAGVNRTDPEKLTVAMDAGTAKIVGGSGEAAYAEVLEMSMPAHDLNRVRLSFWQDGLPIQAIPPQDFLDITEPPGWSA
jgi:hypothetical protein